MRALRLIALSGVFLFAACDSATDITAPETPEPQFHVYPEGSPDGLYSMFYFDLDLTNDLVLRVAQSWDPSESTFKCDDEYSSSHNVDGDELAFPGVGAMHPAQGLGSFVSRTPGKWMRGYLFVKGACWFDEWNPAGFPESAWVYGRAWVGWRVRPFAVMLQSRGFPTLPGQGHLTTLDRAQLFIGDQEIMYPFGELHHNDGFSLLR